MPAKRAFVYILRCADRTFYIGTAKNVQLRLAVHNAGKGAKYTRPRLPVRVVWQEGPLSLTRALQREYQLKQLTRQKKRKKNEISAFFPLAVLHNRDKIS